MPSSPVIEFRAAAIDIDGRPVLRDVAISAIPGALTVLAGPNGAGKTTLLRAMAGLLSGFVRPDPRRVAYLEQGARAAWGLTVGQVAMLGRVPHRDTATGPVARALAVCGVADLAEERVDRISGGQARLAMLARVFATEPAAMLLDEPTADLDPAVAHAMMSLLRRTAEAGTAVIAVSHDVELALAYAHRIIVLAGGRIAADGPPGIIAPALAAAFGMVWADGPVLRPVGPE